MSFGFSLLVNQTKGLWRFFRLLCEVGSNKNKMYFKREKSRQGIKNIFIVVANVLTVFVYKEEKSSCFLPYFPYNELFWML